MKPILPLIFFILFYRCNVMDNSQQDGIDNASVNFSLIDLTNNKFDFNESIKSKELSIIFFGYSHCPDICLNTLREFSKAIEKLTYFQIAKTQFIFVSVDPKVDSNEQLKKFAQNFDPRIVVLRGTELEIEKVKKDFKLTVVLNLEKNKDGSSKMIHSTNIFWIDKNRKKIKTSPYNISATEIVKEVNNRELKR